MLNDWMPSFAYCPAIVLTQLSSVTHRGGRTRGLESFGTTRSRSLRSHCPSVSERTRPHGNSAVSLPSLSRLERALCGFFPDDELAWWAEQITNWQKQGLTVFAYFNNDVNAYAVVNAKTLKAMVAQLALTEKIS